ncbi:MULTISPECIES: hypothetical protein [Oscillatoriales]|uniref:Uncharacterized protein n=2 Tax=Sirenicapillariaceae TaxID=2934961 RepID=A0A5M3TE25_LIMPL|nr:hypothetical protein AP285_27425 [Arthrospira platensis YZ]KDR58600.1 hypothetical protein APPUASWS_004235 [Arthrospira platensis str. Paraca]MBD2575784.1 hypothetical protein [Arthrospira platensis FACHB-971]MBD2669117.1 hypothetical protein [Arthrospira platensis FACHB-439]MBD2712356.1 hypothetical protein [Arthrospira platensis FACHB-835]MDF2208497.1 hypothetical protein [Arthrospira platensis NCB002]MDT9185696.1 hypothetical protein [Limnospira sp. PMC 289.06]MDT9313176.1 hypothetical
MKLNLGIYAVISLMSSYLLLATPAQSQRPSPCSNDNQERPSQRRRQIINREYGLRFDIPANYYTELRSERGHRQQLSIAVRNPTDVEFLECGRREGMRGYGHQVSDVRVTIEPRPSNIGNVRDILRNAATGSSYSQILESNFTTIAGQEAVIYIVQTSYPERYRYGRLIHPNGRYIISISAGDYGERIDVIDLQVMNLIMSTMRIDWQP